MQPSPLFTSSFLDDDPGIADSSDRTDFTGVGREISPGCIHTVQFIPEGIIRTVPRFFPEKE
jgi:hypothetical protein